MKDALHPPFPYFGGKWRAAARVWEALGDPSGYIRHDDPIRPQPTHGNCGRACDCPCLVAGSS